MVSCSCLVRKLLESTWIKEMGKLQRAQGKAYPSPLEKLPP